MQEDRNASAPHKVRELHQSACPARTQGAARSTVPLTAEEVGNRYVPHSPVATVIRHLKFRNHHEERVQTLWHGAGPPIRSTKSANSDEIVFSGPISGKSILQIGTSPSGFCDEVVRRGASFTTVVDSSPDHSERARATAAHGTSVEYIDCDFEEWFANEKSYDIVLCINALHHFYDPVGALRKMMRISRERILLKFATPTFSLRWKDLPFALMSRIPLILMDGRVGATENAADRTFLFTISALRKIFNEHTLAFEPLRIVDPSKKGRATVEVRRRRIGHLVVVAGVACVGKTRFMDALLRSDSLRARFNIETADLEMINAFRVQQPSKPAAAKPRSSLRYSSAFRAPSWAPQSRSCIRSSPLRRTTHRHHSSADPRNNHTALDHQRPALKEARATCKTL